MDAVGGGQGTREDTEAGGIPRGCGTLSEELASRGRPLGGARATSRRPPPPNIFLHQVLVYPDLGARILPGEFPSTPLRTHPPRPPMRREEEEEEAESLLGE